MTPEQRAATVYTLRYGNLHDIDPDNLADQLKADGVTIATLTADRDAARAEIARLTAALATAREDGMREAVDIARVEAAGLRAKSEAPLVGAPQHMRWVAGAIQSDNIADYIEDAITKGSAT